jgi:O-antigen/teichoic acid export membrane protein
VQYCNFQSNVFNKRYAVTAFILSFCVVSVKYILARIWGVGGAVFSNFIVYSTAALFIGVTIKKLYFYNEKDYIPLIKKDRKIVNTYSLQYMLTNSIWAVFMLNDIFMLGHFTGNAIAVANYKVAYVLPANLSIISSSIGIFAAPYFIKNENNSIWVKTNYKKIFLISAVIIGVVTLILFVFARPIIVLLYGEQYAEVAPLMKILLIAAFFNCAVRYTNANLLSAMGK